MRRWWWAGLALVCAVTCARIALTYPVFSPTCDEPIHVAAGYEVLTQHKYTIDSEHPPLARAVFALPLSRRHVAAFDAYARGGDANALRLGDEVLGGPGEMMRNMALARAGNLLFVVLALIGTALLGRDLFGPAAGLAAAVALALAPPFLAHGGLATTDMAGTAALPWALLALRMVIAPHPRFADPLPASRGEGIPGPSPRVSGERVAEGRVSGRAISALLLGLALGIGALCKFSFLLFFAACAVIALIAARRFPVARLLGAVAIAIVVIWAGYLFHHSRMSRMSARAADQTAHFFHSRWLAEKVNLPAPQFLFGLMRVKEHDERGGPAFLLGRFSEHGFWDYFPVVLAVKTPIPLLLLAIAGIRRREHPEVAIMAAALLAIVMTSHINLGVRHILPEYVFLALLAGVAATRFPAAGALLGLWLLLDSTLAHPDYLPWMNAFAGSHPERVVVESNFDWGQDVTRLAEECRKRQIGELGWAVFSTIQPERVGVPHSHPIDPHTPSAGWIAASETILSTLEAQDPSAFAWLTKERDYVRVGKTIRLYRIRTTPSSPSS